MLFRNEMYFDKLRWYSRAEIINNGNVIKDRPIELLEESSVFYVVTLLKIFEVSIKPKF